MLVLHAVAMCTYPVTIDGGSEGIGSQSYIRFVDFTAAACAKSWKASFPTSCKTLLSVILLEPAQTHDQERKEAW
jgi:hypothetical protein